MAAIRFAATGAVLLVLCVAASASGGEHAYLRDADAHARHIRALDSVDTWWCAWYGGCDPYDGVSLSLQSTAANCTGAPSPFAYAPTCAAAARITCQPTVRSYVPYYPVAHNVSKTTTLKSCGLYTGTATTEPTTLPLQVFIVVGTGGTATLSTCTDSSTRSGDSTLIGVMTGTCSTLACVGGATSTACGAHRRVTFTTQKDVEYTVYVTGAGRFTLTASGALRLGDAQLQPTVRRGRTLSFNVISSRDISTSISTSEALLVEPGGSGEATSSSLGFTLTTATSPAPSMQLAVPVTAKAGEYQLRFKIGTLSATATFKVLPQLTLTFNERRKENMDAHFTHRYRAACTPPIPTGVPANTNCATATDLGTLSCNTLLINTTLQATATMAAKKNAYCSWLDTYLKVAAYVQWFKFVSPGGNISISTCSEDTSAMDTFVAAWIGTCPTSTNMKQCDVIRDDSAGCGSFEAKLEMPTTAGTTYYFVVGAHDGAKGAVRITLTGDAAVFNRYTTSVYRRGQEIAFDVDVTSPLDATEALVPSLDLADPVNIPQPINALSAAPSAPLLDAFGYWARPLNDTRIRVSIYPPSNAHIGDYSLALDTGSTRVATVPFTLLFNPAVAQDDVYYDVASLRDEYVMNENGLIWRGSAGLESDGSAANSPYGWGFDQFNLVHLRVAVLGLKDLVGKRLEERRAGFRVARQLSYFIGNDVLWGRWDGDYADGKDPSYWAGSRLLLEQYWTSKAQSKYAQCWVFSGVMTTIGRTLGIPTRSVTNFESAHEDARTEDPKVQPRYKAQVNMYYALSNSQYLSWDTNNDGSVWNFHVWNDMWMRRPDLDKPRPDWNAVDATPQEVSLQDMKYSQAQYQMGPAYLPNVKARDVSPYYDADFVMSEVDADYYEWLCSSKSLSACTQSPADVTKIGQETATKQPGFMVMENPQKSRQVVVADYKNETANTKARPRRADLTERKALAMDAWVEYPTTVDPVAVVALFPEANAAAAPASVVVRVDVELTSYRGHVLRRDVHAAEQTIAPPRVPRGEAVVVRIPVENHHRFVGGNRFLRLLVSVTCTETGDLLFFAPLSANPKVHLDVSLEQSFAVKARNAREARAGHNVLSGTEARAFVRFTNPLSHAITDAHVFLTAGSSSVLGMDGLPYTARVAIGTVEAGATATVRTPRFLATEDGQQTIHASLEAAGLSDVHGHLLLYVRHN